MDRTTELKRDYEQVAGLVKQFKEQRPRVEGDWYLREKVWENGRKSKIISRVESDGRLEGCGPGATIEKMIEWGWTVTPVIILRTIDLED
jgi:hypothetical protein